ncbi:hypothetical protein ACTFIZ_008158 [Dictyostelium cf. discoideum]
MTSNQIHQDDYFTVTVKNINDIPNAVESNANVKSAIENFEKSFSLVSISDALKSFEIIGEFLKVANVASGGQPYYNSMLDLVSDFQVFVNDIYCISGYLVDNSVEILGQYELAIRLKEKPQNAFKIMENIENKVKELSKKLNNLINLSRSLNDQSRNIIQMVICENEKQVTNNQETLEIQDGNTNEENKSIFNSLIRNLNFNENKNDSTLNLIPILINSLDGTIKCLEISRLFWLQVNDKIIHLIDIETLKTLSEIVEVDVELNFDFIKIIKSSGLNWLAFANINCTILNSISSIKKKFDETISNLPSKSESQSIIKSTLNEIEKILLK